MAIELSEEQLSYLEYLGRGSHSVLLESTWDQAAPRLREILERLGKFKGVPWEEVERFVRDAWLKAAERAARTTRPPR